MNPEKANNPSLRKAGESASAAGEERKAAASGEISAKRPQSKGNAQPAEKQVFFIGKTPAALYGGKAQKAFLFVR